MTKKQKVLEIIRRLKKVYPNPKIALNFKNPYELLIATILSAQATDVSVNLATPVLFKKYPRPENLAKADVSGIDKLIKNINFHSNKAKMIKSAAVMVMDKFKGKVPDNMEDLDSLPGVARKSANVVLGSAFNSAEGIVVDTHMIRLSNKLGLTNSKDPVKIEQDLMEIVPKEYWINFPLMLIFHGRHFCTARPHTCEGCPLGDLCPDSTMSLRGA
ncbi:MAG: endonuclease III [Microgenomates group bacterium Gr01-1014_93]|nr:MAG: endonuclease III [Microgenomates group bacterium Gr01-1014_93]